MSTGMNISIYHNDLLEIVFGRAHPGEVEEDEYLPLELADYSTLDLMTRLVKIEFYASLQKEISNNENQTMIPPEPKPFDVFLVEPSFRNKNISIAVSIPVKVKGRRDPVLTWYDENETLWEIVELRRTRKIASLSGTARVLENLATYFVEISPMMKAAMERTNIFDASALAPSSNDSNGGRNLNQSQMKAVTTMKSNAFQNGFFVVQGPPGTGRFITKRYFLSYYLLQ